MRLIIASTGIKVLHIPVGTTESRIVLHFWRFLLSVRVDTRNLSWNPLEDLDKTGKFCHVEQRDNLDSSYYTLRHPTNPDFEFATTKQLPKRHSKSCFKLKEKWVEVTDDCFLTVYGMADKVDGAVTVGTIPTSFGPNMMVTSWSVRNVERFALGFFVGSSISYHV